MSDENKLEESQVQQWTLPVMDSAKAEGEGDGKGFDPNKTGAWTSFAIGAVTKKIGQERRLQNEDVVKPKK